MSRLFHVTSSSNRASIDAHGLDWQRMGAARGIAGSIVPEVDGIFVCTDASDVDFFVRINKHRRAGGRLGDRRDRHAAGRERRRVPPAASSNREGFTSELTTRFDD